MKNPRLIDDTGKRLGRIYPEKITVTLRKNSLSTATIILPPWADVPVVGQMWEIYCDKGSLGVFVTDTVEQHMGDNTSTVVKLSHSVSLLGQRVMPGYSEFGGRGFTIRQVMEQLVSYCPMFQVGQVESTSCLSYAFENENVLTALFSLIKPLDEDYMFTYDFGVFPFKINLVHLTDSDVCEMRLNRNLKNITYNLNGSGIVTRVYPLGYGEGADQLTIKDVNAGSPYITSPAASLYGIREKILVKKEVDDAQLLMKLGTQYLKEHDKPQITITADARELVTLTHSYRDCLETGKICNVILPDEGLELREQIKEITYPDIVKNPQQVQVKMSSVTSNAENPARTAAALQLYSQGSASETALSYYDNCDEAHPAVIRFYVDSGAIHINSLMVCFSVEHFRAYSKSTMAGGSGAATSYDGGGANIILPGETTHANVLGDIPVSGHSLTIIAHKHKVNIPSHTHGITYGIYEDTSHLPTASVYIDGNPVPSSVTASGKFEGVSYLEKDSTGKIKRGAWHTVEFRVSALGRIEAQCNVRQFIRSLEGANL